MKSLILLLCCLPLSALRAEDDGLPERITIGERIFRERFPADRIERMLSRNGEVELARLENGPAQEDVAKIRKILSDVAHDVANNANFRSEYAGWLASQLSKEELEAYLEFIRTELGQKITDLDDRVQPLFASAIQRVSKGRLQALPLLLSEARNK